MRKLKKLGICLSMGIVGAMTIVPIAEAKGNTISMAVTDYYNDVRDSYTEPEYECGGYTIEQVNAIYEQCRVTDPSSLYMDSTIRKYAEAFIKDGFYVGDL